MKNNDDGIGHVVRQANTVFEGLIMPIDKDNYRHRDDIGEVQVSESLMDLYKMRT
jgi:hypothetical protein